MFARSALRPLSRTLLSPTSSLRPLVQVNLQRSYTAISNRTTTQTLIHLSLEDGDDTPDGEHVIVNSTQKQAGQRVHAGEVLGYIEHTTRTEIIAPCNGSIQRVLYTDGEQIELGDDLFVIAQDGEEDEDNYDASHLSGASDLAPNENEDLDDDEDAFDLRESREDDGLLEDDEPLLEIEENEEEEQDDYDDELDLADRNRDQEREPTQRDGERAAEGEGEEEDGDAREREQAEADAEERKKDI